MKFASTRSLAIISLAVASTVGAAIAQRNYFQPFRGTSPDAGMGWGVSQLGDIDRDGIDDWAGAMPFIDNFRGLIHVYSGRTGGRLASVSGIRQNSLFGWSMDDLGDIDGDGYDDWIVGAPGRTRSNIGNALVISGRTHAIIRSQSVPGLGSEFGYSVANLGDLDGDRIPDYAVGSPVATATVPLPAVRVYSGRTGQLIRMVNSGRRFGHAISRFPDVTFDSVPDFLVGAPGNGGTEAGFVALFCGRSFRPLVNLTRSNAGDHFGYSIGNAGDLDGDRRDDVLIGAPRDSVNGAAYIYTLGNRVVRSWRGRSPASGFGWSVATLGDLDIDGDPDYVVGAPSGYSRSGVRTGNISILSGKTGSLLGFSSGPAVASSFGARVAKLDDIEFDGIPEILVGSPTDRGQVSVLTFDYSGASTPFGVGCTGSGGRAQMATQGQIAIGEIMSIVVTRVNPNAPGTLLLGASSRVWSGQSLPYHLGPLGFPGCSLFVSPDVWVPTRSARNGQVTVSFRLPSVPALIGQIGYLQHLVADPSRVGGLAFSNGLAVTVGY